MLTIEAREIRPAAILLQITGRVMITADTSQIEQQVKQALERGTKTILFELAGVTHLDSTGIGRFISCMTMSERAGARILMVGAPPAVRAAFHVTRLDSVFPFFDDLDSALAQVP